MTEQHNSSPSLLDPTRWGLPTEAVTELPGCLRRFWQRYRLCFHARTRDQSGRAYDYLSALLRMEEKRNFAEIGRTMKESGENIQHFMSNSPWQGGKVCRQVQTEIKATPTLHGGALLVDESADAKAGLYSAGSGRQRNGRMGKVDLCQVGVFLTFAKGHQWTWVDFELFLPESWFASEQAALRRKVGIPVQRTFQTKVELAWQMIQRAQHNGLPFEFVACDDLYGRVNWFRATMNRAGIIYMADVPRNSRAYLTRPTWGIPAKSKRQGRTPSRPRVLSPAQSVAVWQVAEDPQTHWQTLRVRPTERGELVAPYAAQRVWTLRDDQPSEEWLVMRRESDGDIQYAFSNAPADTPLERLAWMESQRYFVERSIQDAKSEIGWDEFQAVKFRAWEHQAALTVLASWFVAQTQLDWTQRFPRDANLTTELGVDQLPALSVANVRELLRAAMPLPSLSKQQARELIVTHLLNRTRSRKSRLKKSNLETKTPPNDST
jgi:SRSO17 transposase